MLIATVSTIISLIFLIAFVAAMIILQVYLSRRESKLPGLVLPALSLIHIYRGRSGAPCPVNPAHAARHTHRADRLPKPK